MAKYKITNSHKTRHPGLSSVSKKIYWYLIGCRDFDQGVHLIQPTSIFLLGHTAQTDSVCILVSQELNVTPHRNFVELYRNGERKM